MIQVTIDEKKYEYPENCSYYEIAKDFEKTMDAPIVLVKVDGRLRELHKQLKKDCELEFVRMKSDIKRIREVFPFCWSKQYTMWAATIRSVM